MSLALVFARETRTRSFECAPSLAAIKESLLRAPWSFSSAMMSGSGTSIFAVVEPESEVDLEEFPTLFEKQCARPARVTTNSYEDAPREEEKGRRALSRFLFLRARGGV